METFREGYINHTTDALTSTLASSGRLLEGLSWFVAPKHVVPITSRVRVLREPGDP